MTPVVMTYGALGMAIVLEVMGTTFLQKSEQFSRLVPTVFMAVCYLTSLYLLTHALKTIPLGIAYAIWSGLGIVLVSTIGVVIFRQSLDLPALIGLAFIIIGVVIVNVFSSSIGH